MCNLPKQKQKTVKNTELKRQKLKSEKVKKIKRKIREIKATKIFGSLYKAEHEQICLLCIPMKKWQQ